MSWEDLRNTRWLTPRPITTWPGEMTPAADRRRSPFSARWPATKELLAREIAHLNDGWIDAVVELAIAESDLRLDGYVRAGTQIEHPGVIISFDSSHGPLRYAVDRFTRWHDNIRAIALGLESLRRVDRYGMSGDGQQYRGWLTLEAGTGSELSRGQVLIREHGGVKEALKATHPDHGGDPADFLAVQAAREGATS